MLLVDVLFNHEVPITGNEEMEHSPVFSAEDTINPVRVTLIPTLEDREHRGVVLNGINGRRRRAKVTARVAGNRYFGALAKGSWRLIHVIVKCTVKITVDNCVSD